MVLSGLWHFWGHPVRRPPVCLRGLTFFSVGSQPRVKLFTRHMYEKKTWRGKANRFYKLIFSSVCIPSCLRTGLHISCCSHFKFYLCCGSTEIHMMDLKYMFLLWTGREHVYMTALDLRFSSREFLYPFCYLWVDCWSILPADFSVKWIASSFLSKYWLSFLSPCF